MSEETKDEGLTKDDEMTPDELIAWDRFVAIAIKYVMREPNQHPSRLAGMAFGIANAMIAERRKWKASPAKQSDHIPHP